MNKITFNHIEEEIVALTKAQAKHNNLMERTYGLEKAQAELSRDVKTLYNNLDDVKGDVRDVRSNVDTIIKDVADIKASEVRLEERIK